uniref:Uncharacterized protein n=1 Tax=Oryza punctata TaxID=4537 RepID=A0A0E0LLD3_ORYPU
MAHNPNDRDVYFREHIWWITQQDEIASNEGADDDLTWDDVSSMKYRWKVAMETQRTILHFFGSFRTATKDIECQGSRIPKGWVVKFVW